MAKRIQLKRAKGWTIGDAVKVDRTTPFGNPFTVAEILAEGFADNAAEAREIAVERHRAWLFGLYPYNGAEHDVIRSGSRDFDRRWVQAHIDDLAGKTLGCWCGPDDCCHADLLNGLADDAENFNG